MGYNTCPFCGANLDPQEKCDCQNEKAPDVLADSRGADVNNQVQDTPESKQCQGSVLDEMIKLHKEFRRIYDSSGLLSVDPESSIHLREDFFLKTFPKYQVNPRNDETYPFKLSVEYRDTTFFCVTAKLPEGVSDVL